MQSLAHIRDASKTIQATIANCIVAHANMSSTVRTLAGTNCLVTRYFGDIIETLQIGDQWEIELAVNRICEIFSAQLKTLPRVGPIGEIKAADTIANTYLTKYQEINNNTLRQTLNDAIANTPTQPNTPPIHIPAPTRKEKEILIISDSENDNMSSVSSTEDPTDMQEEVNILFNFLKSFTPPPEPQTFSPPKGYTTMILNGEKDPEYWSKILEALIDVKGTMGTYCRTGIRYIRTGMDNAPQFIAPYGKTFLIASSKKKLFQTIL